jgi:hypothetical protein
METLWIFVIYVLIVLSLVSMVFGQQALATLLATVGAFVSLSWIFIQRPPHIKGKKRMIFSASKSDTQRLTVNDIFPPEAANIIKTHFAQATTDNLVMYKDKDGKWQKYETGTETDNG